MKKSFILVFILFSTTLFGQNLVQNGGFSSVTTPVPECSYPFHNPTAVANWTTSQGTPQVEGGSACSTIHATPRDGYFAWMTESEGIYQSFNFQAGKAYRVSFWATDGTASTTLLKLEAANGLTPYTGTWTDTEPSIASNQRQLIYSGNTGESWGQTTIDFFPIQNFSQLWIYVPLSQPYGSTGASVDDIVIIEIPAVNQTSGTSGLVCSGGNTFQSAYTSSSYSWSSPTGNLSISGSGNSVTVTPTGSGNATLCVQVDNGQTYCTQFWTGVPLINSITTFNNYNQPPNSTDMCNGYGLNVQVNTTQASSSSWSVTSGGSYYFTDYGNGIAYFNSYVNDCYGLSVTASNTCGNANNGVTICVEDCFSYRIYPNPAKDNFYMEFEKTDNLASLPERVELLSEKTTIPIRSINIQEVYERKGFKNGNRLEFDVKDLPRGIYYIHVINSKRKEKEKESIRVVIE